MHEKYMRSTGQAHTKWSLFLKISNPSQSRKGTKNHKDCKFPQRSTTGGLVHQLAISWIVLTAKYLVDNCYTQHCLKFKEATYSSYSWGSRFLCGLWPHLKHKKSLDAKHKPNNTTRGCGSTENTHVRRRNRLWKYGTYNRSCESKRHSPC